MKYTIYRNWNGAWFISDATDERVIAIRHADRYFEVDRARYIKHGVKVWDEKESRWCYKIEC